MERSEEDSECIQDSLGDKHIFRSLVQVGKRHLHGFCPHSTGWGASDDSQGLTDTLPRAKQVGNLGLQSRTFCDVGDPWCQHGNGPGHGPGTTVAEEGTAPPGEDEDAESKEPVCSLLGDSAGPCLQTPSGEQ